MAGPEAKIENAICAYVASRGGLALKLQLAGQRGFPDRTFLLPGGIALFVEVKRLRGGKVSHEQERWIKKLRALGFVAIVATTLEQTKQAIEAAYDF